MDSSSQLNKVDLSLDEIIKLTKKGRGRGRGQAAGGRQRKPGGLQKRSWKTPGGKVKTGGTGPAATRTRAQQRAQQLRQKARDQRRGLVSDQPSTSTPQRRGGRGRGRGARGGGVKARLGQVQQTPGSNVQLTRGQKGSRGRGRGRGRGGIQATRATLQVNQQLRKSGTAASRGRGRGGGRGRGRGQGGQKFISGRQSTADTSGLHVSVINDPEMEPSGVDLPPDFAVSHHTSQSLDNRFTPMSSQQDLAERLVMSGGRAVNYQN